MPDGLARALSVLFIAIPGFWLGMLIVLAFLFWFGYKAPILIVPIHRAESWQNYRSSPVRPWSSAGPGRLHRADVALVSARVIGEDFVRTAVRRGSASGSCDAPRAAQRAPAVITISGVCSASSSAARSRWTGLRRAGLGRALVTAVIERDIIVVQNLVLLYAVIFVGVNVLVDSAYAWLDPRIRYG